MALGKVYLVGAGFGGPEHLTLKALRVLEEAEVVLHDRLVHPEILALARGEKVPVGKEGYGPKTPQEEIHRRLIHLARQGLVVARLHGGDPMVFGRGGEEVLALKAAGVPFEVVPGLTSAVGAPSLLGLPLTFRGRARSFAVATGHDPSQPLPQADTLVLLMPLHALTGLKARLMERFPPETPLALLARVGWPGEEVRLGRVADLPGLGEGLPSPALLVVGEVVGLA
ncbi:uroporphyrin-III C-methyltransferase (plasmid) [Thermus oshimai JL-2]|mgnify:CR=1 FL=1|uniref:uroporphyrinogen-III C-methyltransferase n=1 Tax=Thermus oshimai JL-2 TaxID=751945 RepID=K7QZ19_THEOS|nr:uroporphyrinogen-III C-methyltransferase [Thermus oshimai]AFV77313.1 uroporphyrin-III C-methyltransferase [Thermus oshimai JL-2]